jgi:hypothetical protein
MQGLKRRAMRCGWMHYKISFLGIYKMVLGSNESFQDRIKILRPNHILGINWKEDELLSDPERDRMTFRLQSEQERIISL